MAYLEELMKVPFLKGILAVCFIILSVFPPFLALFWLRPDFFLKTDFLKILAITAGYGASVTSYNLLYCFITSLAVIFKDKYKNDVMHAAMLNGSPFAIISTTLGYLIAFILKLIITNLSVLFLTVTILGICTFFNIILMILVIRINDFRKAY